MKVCEKCGGDISGYKDGENICHDCQTVYDTSRDNVNKQRRAIANRQRRERADAMRSLGLVKVRGALGGTYWE